MNDMGCRRQSRNLEYNIKRSSVQVSWTLKTDLFERPQPTYFFAACGHKKPDFSLHLIHPTVVTTWQIDDLERVFLT